MGSAKDWMIEKTLPAVLNQSLLRPYGRLTHFKLDSERRAAEVELQLDGELQPLHVRIERFELTTSNGEAYVEIHEMTTSRQWLTQLANDQVIGKRFKIPARAAKYAEMLL